MNSCFSWLGRLCLAVLLLCPCLARANHHRGGRVAWERVSGSTYKVLFQVAFERSGGLPGASGVGGYPLVGDVIPDPLSLDLGTHTTLEITDGPDEAAQVFYSVGYNLGDTNRLRVVAITEGALVCEPDVPPEFTLPPAGHTGTIYYAKLRLYARAEESFQGGEGLFNRFSGSHVSQKLTAIITAKLDLSAPGATTSSNTPPKFSNNLPATLVFQANQILTDLSSGNPTAGATLTPPGAIPFQVIDPDVSNDPHSDIITFRIKNTDLDPAHRDLDDAGVPGLTINNSGQLTWQPAAIPTPERRQTQGAWSVTIIVEDWAWNNTSQPKSSTECELLLRINEPTTGVPALRLYSDQYSQTELFDPIPITVTAGTTATLAYYDFEDSDIHSKVTGEVVLGVPKVSFDAPDGFVPVDFNDNRLVLFTAGLADVHQNPQDYTEVQIRGRDDDGLPTALRTFRVHVDPAVPATLSVAIERKPGAAYNWVQAAPRMRLATTNTQATVLRIVAKRTPQDGSRSAIPLTLSGSWEHPLGTLTPTPITAQFIPNLPLSGKAEYLVLFRWTPSLADLGQHRVSFAVTDGSGGSASASIEFEVAPFSLSFNGGNESDIYDRTVEAWRLLHGTFQDVEPGAVFSFPGLPKGVRVEGNQIRYRPMGSQVGLTSIPVQVTGLAGGIAYSSTIQINVTQPTSPPAWWTIDDSQRRVIDQNVSAQDHAMANQGQVKHIARMAALAIYEEAVFAESVNDPLLVSSTEASTLKNAVDGLTPNTNNYLPCNQGQVKNLASLFYDLFDAKGILVHPDGPTVFPWTSSTDDDRNYAPVNLGQVKSLFNFPPHLFRPNP